MTETKRAPVRVLMVCMGNICRSPTAEAVLRAKLERAGLADDVEVDSAGTHADWHKGEAPDKRSQQHARRRGYDLSALRARKVEAGDFERFDLILAMDDDNLGELESRCPPALRPKLRRLIDGDGLNAVVPDPYYGDAAAFEDVLDRVEAACDVWVEKLAKQRHRRQQGTS